MRGTARPFLATTTVGGVVWLTPFNPTEVVAEIAGLLKSYRLTSCVRDHYAAGWVVEAFSKAGITYRHSDRNRSAIYSDALPLFASGRARLLDNPRLVGQFCGLERRTSPGGKDRIDHGPNGHDDLANAAAGALVGWSMATCWRSTV